ncbi:MAG: methylamine utilization protein MauE [Proteobacteria bacterium]|nr:methylamine utilization protein MauE [Pseudomonadota bacterium]
MSIDPAVACLIAACVGLLFLVAAIHKLRDLRRFREVFAAYRLAPPAAGRALAPVVPALELAVAVGLLFDNLRTPALWTGIALLLLYVAGIAINLARGRRDLDCGCAGPYDRRPIAAWMIWRNLGIAIVLAAALLPWSGRPMVLTDAVTIGFGTACCALVYLCLDRLLTPARAP